MAEPKFDQLNIVVDDMDAAVAFYERLGFEVGGMDAEWSAWLPHHRNLVAPGAVDVDLDSVAFARVWGGIEEPCVVVNARMATRDDVDTTYDGLVADGHAGIKPPYDAFWGSRYALVRDPAGNPLGIMSPADPAHRVPMPDPPS